MSKDQSSHRYRTKSQRKPSAKRQRMLTYRELLKREGLTPITTYLPRAELVALVTVLSNQLDKDDPKRAYTKARDKLYSITGPLGPTAPTQTG